MNSMLILASMASVIPFSNSMTVTAHVKDEAGNPAAGAIVKIWTDKDRYQGLARSPTYSYFEAVSDVLFYDRLTLPDKNRRRAGRPRAPLCVRRMAESA